MDDPKLDTPTDPPAEAPHLATIGGIPPEGPTTASAPKDGDGVVLRTVYPTDVFEHGIKGAEPITATGTAVSKSAASQIKKLAKRTPDVEVEEV
jgi:hypothetical protein